MTKLTLFFNATLFCLMNVVLLANSCKNTNESKDISIIYSVKKQISLQNSYEIATLYNEVNLCTEPTTYSITLSNMKPNSKDLNLLADIFKGCLSESKACASSKTTSENSNYHSPSKNSNYEIVSFKTENCDITLAALEWLFSYLPANIINFYIENDERDKSDFDPEYAVRVQNLNEMLLTKIGLNQKYKNTYPTNQHNK